MVVPASMSRLTPRSAQKSCRCARPARPSVTMRSLIDESLRTVNRLETSRTRTTAGRSARGGRDAFMIGCGSQFLSEVALQPQENPVASEEEEDADDERNREAQKEVGRLGGVLARDPERLLE